MQMVWYMTHPDLDISRVSGIAALLDGSDERPAKEQFMENFIGGWSSFKGFVFNRDNWDLDYPGDPTMRPIAYSRLHGETVIVYPGDWVLIDGKDGVDVARIH